MSATNTDVLCIVLKKFSYRKVMLCEQVVDDGMAESTKMPIV